MWPQNTIFCEKKFKLWPQNASFCAQNNNNDTFFREQFIYFLNVMFRAPYNTMPSDLKQILVQYIQAEKCICLSFRKWKVADVATKSLLLSTLQQLKCVVGLARQYLSLPLGKNPVSWLFIYGFYFENPSSSTHFMWVLNTNFDTVNN